MKVPDDFPPIGGGAYRTGGVVADSGTSVAAGATTTAAATTSRLSSMATSFGAAILVEFLFFLIDKLVGGKLSGQANKVDAEPKAVEKTAENMQGTAAAVKQQAGAIDGLAGKLAGLAQSQAIVEALRQVQDQTKAATQSADEQKKVAKDSVDMADMLGQAQILFMQLVRRYGKSVMTALNSWFGAFMALVIAGLAVKIILMLVGKLINKIIGKSQAMKAATGAKVEAIAAAQQQVSPAPAVSTSPPPSSANPTATTMTGAPGNPAAPGQGAVATGMPAGATAPSAGSPGWEPAPGTVGGTGGVTAPPSGNRLRVTFDPTTRAVTGFEAEGDAAGQRHVVQVSADTDRDGDLDPVAQYVFGPGGEAAKPA